MMHMSWIVKYTCSGVGQCIRVTENHHNIVLHLFYGWEFWMMWKTSILWTRRLGGSTYKDDLSTWIAGRLSTRSPFVVCRLLWFQPAHTEDKARGMDREEWLDTKASLASHWKMVPSPQQLSVLLLKPIATVAIMLWEWLFVTACCVRKLRTVAMQADSRNGWTPNLGFGRVPYNPACKQTDAMFRKGPRTSAESLVWPKARTGFWKHVIYAETGAFGKVSCMWHADIRARQITYKTRNC